MRIAYAGLRRKEEFKALAEKLGLTPLLFPVQATERVPVPEYQDHLRQLKGGVDLFVATTGVGVRELMEGGRILGLDLKGSLEKALRLARGAKAARALRDLGLPPHGVGDGTTPSLLPLLPQGPGVAALQLYGKPLPALEQVLEKRGYRVLSLMPYRHLPDIQGIRLLEKAILSHQVDAVAFVAAIQVEFLLEEAEDPGALRQTLNGEVRALAVGRVTADALREWGVRPFYVDEKERLGSTLQGFLRSIRGAA
ncbi:uroporphyrinogen-III synthase [Thermus thermamylovorans]|uniref:Uroporphyrinogen-III synthase n=1 Tax=Thermus thermamylovorans TaxID=2509362 RepID=A0A4Q9B6W0_9DEIN|nr:uroporphyrinogen-III synthase [Thermus thermamylovorans]TBH20822.1 uroporphyrinogen-III synthase [Thermus thermamylovorans]